MLMSVETDSARRDRPEPVGGDGRYGSRVPRVPPDPAEQLRREIVSDPLNARLPASLSSSYADALAELALCDRDSVHLPAEGLSFKCEACGDLDTVQGRRKSWAVWIPWARVPVGSDDFEDVLTPLVDWPHGDRGTAEDVADHLVRLRFERNPNGDQLIYRLTLVCRRCGRRDTEGAGLIRCRHEEAAMAADWCRCRSLAVTSGYCAAHTAPELKRERERYARAVASGVRPEVGHRRATDDVPSLVATPGDRCRRDLQLKLATWIPTRAKRS